jgi:hypothetical protein
MSFRLHSPQVKTQNTQKHFQPRKLAKTDIDARIQESQVTQRATEAAPSTSNTLLQLIHQHGSSQSANTS